MITCYDGKNFHEVWPRVEKWLIDNGARLMRGNDSVEEVKRDIERSHSQLWVFETESAFGVVVSQVVQYPLRKVCFIKFGTGYNAKEWAIPIISLIEKFAEHSGCGAVEICARPGWIKLLQEAGYGSRHILLTKELES
ncbi:hypothetical protein [Paraburkholderia terrae]|uniref:hypothetical protein n=1 Tax=Paraburkholderia terrae TaxID=311230 RepID=UPI0020528F9E|nr:hypothetical protein [Paraburkholderia terrae]BDC37922.1 hypothetical protein PTKU15_12190 [Paraburkholderia terrae]